MLAEIYTNLKNHIISGMTEVKHVALFNNQISVVQAATNKEKAFKTPACFIDFGTQPIRYTSSGKGVQFADTTLRLHLVVQSLKDEDLSVFTLKDQLHLTAMSFKQNYVSPFERVTKNVDTNHGNLIVYTIDYKVRYQDNSLACSKPTTPINVTIDLITDLSIDPRTVNTVRTGTL